MTILHHIRIWDLRFSWWYTYKTTQCHNPEDSNQHHIKRSKYQNGKAENMVYMWNSKQCFFMWTAQVKLHQTAQGGLRDANTETTTACILFFFSFHQHLCRFQFWLIMCLPVLINPNYINFINGITSKYHNIVLY